MKEEVCICAHWIELPLKNSYSELLASVADVSWYKTFKHSFAKIIITLVAKPNEYFPLEPIFLLNQSLTCVRAKKKFALIASVPLFYL